MNRGRWSLADMPDQAGKVMVITGGNSGLGFETAKAFALKGAHVIIACRSMEKGAKARNKILQESRVAKISVMTIDLTDLSSIRRFAEKFKQQYFRLDILMNNAGIMASPFALTIDGFESQMATNHLGHFALTGLLLDTIINTPNSRVVMVSSLAHKMIRNGNGNSISFFKDSNGYKPFRAYCQSKLANILFTYELQRRFELYGCQSIAVAAHPGASYTHLGRFQESKPWVRFLLPLIRVVLPTPQSASLAQIRAASDPTVKGGQYFGPSGLLQLAGYPVQVKSSELSYNAEKAKELWKYSEQLTNIRYRIGDVNSKASLATA